LPADESARLLKDPSLFRFAFVRNPWDRLVSAFTNKFIPNKTPAQQFLKALQWRRRWRGVLSFVTAGLIPGESDPGWDSSRPLFEQFTFRQFVNELEQLAPDSFDLHWRPQYLFLGDQQLNFLGRFERLDADFVQICRQLKIEQTLPHRNHTPRQTVENVCLADWPVARLATLSRYPDYTHFYTDDLIRRVGDVYHEDVSRFSYDFGELQTSSRAA
jgi:hypothetical protein